VSMRCPTCRFWSGVRFGVRRPSLIEHQEFEYTRHGTVNLLLFLIVHSGRMELAVDPKKTRSGYIGPCELFAVGIVACAGCI